MLRNDPAHGRVGVQPQPGLDLVGALHPEPALEEIRPGVGVRLGQRRIVHIAPAGGWADEKPTGGRMILPSRTRGGMRAVEWMEMMGDPRAFLSVGAPVGVPVLARSVPTMDDILAALQRAQANLAHQCAVASLGHFVPAMRGLPGFAELHKENYGVSYHLTTAIGAAEKILAGAREPGYFALVVTCQREAGEHQRKALQAFRQLAAAAPAGIRPLVQRLGGHMQATTGHIQRAAGLSVTALGPEVIRELVEWTEATPHR